EPAGAPGGAGCHGNSAWKVLRPAPQADLGVRPRRGAMREVAGAILVLAGSVLIAGGLVADAVTRGEGGYGRPGHGLGTAVGLIGVFALVGAALRRGRDPLPVGHGPPGSAGAGGRATRGRGARRAPPWAA